MRDSDSVVAVYSAHKDAEAAIRKLQKSGYDIRNLSIVVRDYHIKERVLGFYNPADRIKDWATDGVFWGGALGLLFAAAHYFIPGIGSGRIIDPMAVWIGGVLGGGFTIGGLSAIGAAIYGMKLPADSVLKYELAIEPDHEFSLVAHGAAVETAVAREIIWRASATQSGVDSSAPWRRSETMSHGHYV